MGGTFILRRPETSSGRGEIETNLLEDTLPFEVQDEDD